MCHSCLHLSAVLVYMYTYVILVYICLLFLPLWLFEYIYVMYVIMLVCITSCHQTSCYLFYFLSPMLTSCSCHQCSLPVPVTNVPFCQSLSTRLASPLTLDEFGWSRPDSTLYNNIMFACSALIAVATFIVVKFISKKFVTYTYIVHAQMPYYTVHLCVITLYTTTTQYITRQQHTQYHSYQ